MLAWSQQSIRIPPPHELPGPSHIRTRRRHVLASRPRGAAGRGERAMARPRTSYVWRGLRCAYGAVAGPVARPARRGTLSSARPRPRVRRRPAPWRRRPRAARPRRLRRSRSPARFPGSANWTACLGGGLVAGSVTLLGGDPGIGKSTLLLQASDALSRERTVLYASGEESVRQVALRASRLGLASGSLRLLAETRVETILEEAAATRASVLVADSIQTMHTDLSESSPGSAVQVRRLGRAPRPVRPRTPVPPC